MVKTWKCGSFIQTWQFSTEDSVVENYQIPVINTFLRHEYDNHGSSEIIAINQIN